MSSRLARGARDERGFTLVEVMVTMSLATIVLLATLGASEIFSTSAKSIDRSTAAQDSARTTVRSMVATLRQGRFAPGQDSPIPAAWTPSRTDLTLATYVDAAGGTATAPGWVRYCAASTGTRSSLIMGVRTGDAYAAPGACSATDGTNGWTHKVVLDRTLLTAARLFDFTSSSCSGAACLPAAADVQAVGIRVAVGTSREVDGTFNSVVRDAVSFRNRSSS